MNKLPTKQIYLLSIIVFGIITLSIYSTYSIFTLESESSEVVSIHTPGNLSVSMESDEYKQVSIPANSYITTDIDIYNNYSYDICYSIWYKVVGKSIDNSKIKIYQITSESLTTSSTLQTVSNRRINLLIINDNDVDAKVNIGLYSSENKETCELNIAKDKLQIVNSIANYDVLSTNIINNTKTEPNEAGYITYKDIEKRIELSNDIYVSKEFTYKDELFTLTDPKLVEVNKLSENEATKLSEYNDYYTCLDKEECQFLYNIVDTDDNNITKYHLLSGYLSGNVGLKKIKNDYYFYGDNPNNFIYFNCNNELDNKTCELWRIIGFIYDEEEKKYLTKIIKEDYLLNDKYSDNSQIWNKSTIYEYFTKDYKINDNYLKEISFKQANVTDLNINISDIITYGDTFKTNTTIIELTDYLYASVCEDTAINKYNAICLKNNWLNRNSNLNEWTTTINYMAPYEDEETKEMITPDNDTIYSVGNTIEETNIQTKLNIRPVVYLKSRMLLTAGDGSFENPYIIR